MFDQKIQKKLVPDVEEARTEMKADNTNMWGYFKALVPLRYATLRGRPQRQGLFIKPPHICAVIFF